jgi:hypothetical protein
MRRMHPSESEKKQTDHHRTLEVDIVFVFSASHTAMHHPISSILSKEYEYQHETPMNMHTNTYARRRRGEKKCTNAKLDARMID